MSTIDLDPIFLRLNHQYFAGKLKSKILWGNERKGRKYSILLGKYDMEKGEIRLHPILKKSFVPFYYLEYVIFHEMLHVHVGVKKRRGRKPGWIYHSPEFKHWEREFLYFNEAVKWEKENIQFLLNPTKHPDI